MTYLERAKQLEKETLANRRQLHRHAETGFDLPETTAFVLARLCEYGYSPQRVGKAGITCTAGAGEKTILLRCDMDALPFPEESGLPFAAKNGNCHACGHDLHTAMLLCAAKMLKERESELHGTVKLMFQPAEELIAGAQDMIQGGVLENPHVDAAIGLHVKTGRPTSKSGCLYFREGGMSLAGDSLNIRVHGKTAHGATPQLGIDAIAAAMQIGNALNQLAAKAAPPGKTASILIGKIWGGTANNTVSETCEMALSVRSENHEIRSLLMTKIRSTCEHIAAACGARAEIIHNFYIPAVENEAGLTRELMHYASHLLSPDRVLAGPALEGGEDFSLISELVPSTFLILGAGSPEEGYPHYLHDPKIRFDEAALPVGAAALAYCAQAWLKNHEKDGSPNEL